MLEQQDGKKCVARTKGHGTAPMSHIHYLPLAPGFFAILVGFFFLVIILRSVRYAYESLGVSSKNAHAIRASLLASAIAATLVCRRASNAVSQGRCFVPWILA
jgi:hypothetical protein